MNRGPIGAPPPSEPPSAPNRGGVPATRLWVRAATTAGTIGLVVGVFVVLGELGVYDLPFILQYLPSGIGPAVLSVELTCLSFAIGFVLALPLAVVRASPPGSTGGGRAGSRGSVVWRVLGWPLYGFATAYVAVIRGTPFLVQVFLVYFAVIFAYPRFTFLGAGVSFWAGLLALVLNTTGYQAEAMRGGFQSVDAPQIEAARAIGMTGFQVFWHVTFPQGIRLVTLPLTNEWISNFKTSAILSYIALAELFSWSRTYIAYQLARPIEAFVMIAIFYLVINVTLSRVVSYLEEKRRIPGLGTPLRDPSAA